jgi:hypothetical protein
MDRLVEEVDPLVLFFTEENEKLKKEMALLISEDISMIEYNYSNN